MRFRLFPTSPSIDFFKPLGMKFWLAVSILGMVLASSSCRSAG